MAEVFEQATSANLPQVDADMIDDFYRRNVDFLIPGVQNVKAERSGRAGYADDAVGYVQLRRSGSICTIKAELTPEHKVRQKGYHVTVSIDEAEQVILEAKCHDCIASEGGCKHGVAFVFWLHRKTILPSVTEVECYWRKSTLSRVGTTLKGERIRDIYQERNVTPLPPKGTSFLERVVAKGLEQHSSSILLQFFREEQKLLDRVSLFKLCLKYKSTLTEDRTPNADEFIEYCKSTMTDEDCKEVMRETVLQSKEKKWFEVRQGRITASKFYEVAHCKTLEGATTAAVLGASKFRATHAMQRGLKLEDEVLGVLKKEKKITYKKVGIAISKEYPLFGASADALTDDYCIEIKCPSKTTTIRDYIDEDGSITPKPFVQMQLQMLLYGKGLGLFVVASPNFEEDRKITILEVPFEEQFCLNLLEQAIAFWKAAIFPFLIK